jgi:flagellar biosynthesis protein
MTEDIFDPNMVAVALKYDEQNSPAPKIVATGKGHVAERIISLAKAHGVEIHNNNELAQMLSSLELDSLIPLEAYTAVAEILVYIYRTNRDQKNK